MNKQLFALLWLFLPLSVLYGQVILTPLGAPETMVACGQSERFTLSVINSDANGYGNRVLDVQLPTGMEYVPGSLMGDVEEWDTSNPLRPQFRFVGLPALSSRQISFAAIINCAFVNDAGTQYSMVVGPDTIRATGATLANYFFPEVVITDVDFPVLNLAVSGTGTRQFTIIQSTQGARLDTIYFVNRYEPGMASLGINAGTLIGSSPGADTFMITGAALPGNDGGFDFGDTLRVTETVRLLDCAPANSTIELYWRCGTVTCQRFVTNTLLTQATGAPDLRITNRTGFPNQAAASNPSVVGGGFCDTLRLRYQLQNLGEEDAPGAGAVYNLVLGLGLNNNLFSNSMPFDLGIFPNWRIQATINGVAIDLGPYAYPVANPITGYNLRFDQFTTDPDGPGGLADVDGDGLYDDLPVGSSAFVDVAIVYDPYATTGCAYLSGYPYNGGSETVFRVGYHYSDQCATPLSYWYSVNDQGINVVSLFTHRAVTYTVEMEENNLAPGQVTTLEIRPDGAWNSPCGATDSLVLEVVLPDGLVAAGGSFGPGTFGGIVRQSGDTVWLASNERGTLTQPWGLTVMLDCSREIVDTTINLSFLYYCDTDCGPAKRINCAEIGIDYLAQCEPCLEGIDTRSFDARRLNVGWTDASHTTRVNATNTPALNLAAALNRDSVALQLTGVYRGVGPFNDLRARITYRSMLSNLVANPLLPQFMPMGSSVQYFATDGTVYDCAEAGISTDYNAATEEHIINSNLEAFFQPGGCLENVVRTAGDSIVFIIYTLVTDNTPRRATPVPDLTGLLYLVQNGIEVSCNRYLDNFLLEEVVPNVNLGYAAQAHYGCEEIYFNNNAVANPGHIYDEDQFPDEVRSIADVSEIRMLLEGNWQHVPGSSDLLANGSFDANDAVSVTAPFVIVSLPNPEVRFDGAFTTFVYTNPGNWPAGDLAIGGSNPVHNVRFRAVPGCLVPSGTPFQMRLEADMVRYPDAPPAWRDTVTSVRTLATKTYFRPTANLLPATPQAFIPNTDTVSWTLNINNTTNYGHPDKTIRNAWLSIDANSVVQIIAIDEVTNPANPVALPFEIYNSGNSYWIRFGNINPFESRNFRIRAIYRDCLPQTLTATLGYSCFGYPTPDPDTGYPLAGTFYDCPVQTLPLYIQPTPVSLSLVVEGPPIPADLCEELQYGLLVSNVNLPSAYNNVVETTLPFGASVLPATSRIEWPAGSDNWRTLSDPTYLGNNRYRWDVANDPNGVAQLLGVNRAPANAYRLVFRMQTECGLTAGLRIGFVVDALNSCGQSALKRVFSEKLLIAGIPEFLNNYALFLDVPDGGLQACDSTDVRAKLVNLGPLPTSESESALITVPADFGLRPETVSGNTALLQEQVFDDRRLLRFQIPAGIAAGDSIFVQFRLDDLRSRELACAEPAQLTLATVLESDVPCRDDFCAIYLVLNSDTLDVPILKDELHLDLLRHQSINEGSDNELITSMLRLTNLDAFPVRMDSLVWEVYEDTNNSGAVEIGVDIPVFSSPIRPIELPGGGMWTDSIAFSVSTTQTCRLLLTYRNTGYSCLCSPPMVLALPAPQIMNAGADQTICSGDTATLGVDVRGLPVSYAWTPVGGSGTLPEFTDRAITPFTITNMGVATQTYRFALETSRGPNCTTQDTVRVDVLPALRATTEVATDYNGQDISCYGASDGGLRVRLELAAAPVVYDLDGLLQTDLPLFTNLAAGTYTFGITDANGCHAQALGTLTQPDSLQLTAATMAVVCHGDSDGEITLAVLGGTPSYEYTWSNGSADERTADNLPSGWYGVTITDANACALAVDSLFVGQPDPIGYTFSIDSTQCSYSRDGQLRIDSLAGGTPPLSVAWSDGTTALANTQLPKGNDLLTVRDGAGCTVQIPYTIPGPEALAVTLDDQSDVTCFGLSDGALAVEVSGGTEPYRYTWSNGAAADSIGGLPAGTYRLSVTDANDCTLPPTEYTIVQPARIELPTQNITGVSCFGDADGRIQVAAQGGVGAYRYTWDTTAEGDAIDSLRSGNYTVTVSDANDCAQTYTLYVGEPLPLSSTLVQEPPACSGNLGYLTFLTTGGTTPYQYSVDDGATFSTVARQGVAPGVYSTVVRDANGCETFDDAELEEPLPIIIDAPASITINYGDTLQLNAYVYNVRGDTLVAWRPFTGDLSCTDCLSPVLYARQTMAYFLRVTDSYQCVAEVRIPVLVERPRRLYIPNAFSPNGDGDNDVLYPFGAREVVDIVQFEVYNRWGQQVFARTNVAPNDPTQGWDGTYRGAPLPGGVYVYQLQVRYLDGEVLPYAGDVILMR